MSATLDKSGASPSTVTAPRSPEAAPAAPPAASVIVPPYELTDRSAESESPSATVVEKTRAVEPVPLAYVAVSPLDRVRVGVPVTVTASSQVTVMDSDSPTPYEPSVAATLAKSGASPSTVTEPRSPDAAPAAPPAASAIVPLNELTCRSEEALSPSAMVVLKTRSVLPVPL